MVKNRITLSMVIIFIIAVIINLTGCSASPVDTKQSNTENTLSDKSDLDQSNKEKTLETDNKNTIDTSLQDRPETSKYIDKKESIYFFINGLFLGSYDNMGWHSICNTRYDYQGWLNAIRSEQEGSVTFFAKDILNKDAFYVYSCNYKSNEFIGESKQIVWPINQIFDVDAQKELAKYGELYDIEGSYYEPRYFNLPVKLGAEANNIEIVNSQFYSAFKTDKKVDSNRDDFELVTNTKSILFPKTFSSAANPTKEGVDALNSLFKNNNMENTLPNFTRTIVGDFDNDGKDEYLMIANSPWGDNYWPAIIGEGKKDKVGTFSAIIYQDDDGSVQILHQDMRPIEGIVEFTNGIIELMNVENFHFADLGIIADLNGDGLMEININGSLWEMHNEIVYSQNTEGVYDAVLRSYAFTNGPTF